MDYPDEPYVRKYPRKTLNWHRLGWEGRAVKDAMLGEFDRAGIYDLEGADAAEAIALVTGIPLEVVRIGLDRLLNVTKTWKLTPARLVWPNYVPAQTCAKSDKVRQAECRARRAELAAAADDGDVTLGHEPSREVTPNLAAPNTTDPISSEAREVFEGELVEPEAESTARPKSSPPRGRRRRNRPDGHWQFPAGWQWSTATAAAAAREGITPAELRDHVLYWTTRMWNSEVTDLDGELVRSFKGIKERRAAALLVAPNANAPPNPYAWAPTREHRDFASSKGLDAPGLAVFVQAYRASGRPDAIGTLPACDDFMRRLRSWAETGEFRPTGPLPRIEAARGAA